MPSSEGNAGSSRMERKIDGIEETYLGYPTDWTLERDLQVARKFMEDADLFILQDGLVFIDELPFTSIVEYALIINGTGSRLRNNDHGRAQCRRKRWAIVPMLCDSTLSSTDFSPPFENWIGCQSRE